MKQRIIAPEAVEEVEYTSEERARIERQCRDAGVAGPIHIIGLKLKGIKIVTEDAIAALRISGLVAEKIIGLDIQWQFDRPWMYDRRKSIPLFAIDRSLVWQITDTMQQQGYIWTIGSSEHLGEQVAAIFHMPTDTSWTDLKRWTAGDSEAMVVSLAALKAKGVDITP